MLLFSASLMLVVAALACGVGAKTYRAPRAVNVSECLLVGFGVGLLTGFLGVGGGFMIVPALVLFAGLDSRLAAGTSLVVIVFNCATGLVGQLRFIRIDWTLLSGFLIFAVAGMLLGTTLCGRIPEKGIRRIFAVTVLVVGITIGVNNLL